MSVSKIDKIQGRSIAIRGNDIDTDRIIPARFLKALTFSELGQYPFYDERHDKDGNPKDHPFNRESSQGANMLFVNSNFGCGSSREHAPQSLRRWGIEALVGISFGEIFAGNCEMLGIPALEASEDDIAKLQEVADSEPATSWQVDLSKMKISGGGVSAEIVMNEQRRKSLMAGHWDTTGGLVANLDKVREVHARLPYTSGYQSMDQK